MDSRVLRSSWTDFPSSPRWCGPREEGAFLEFVVVGGSLYVVIGAIRVGGGFSRKRVEVRRRSRGYDGRGLELLRWRTQLQSQLTESPSPMADAVEALVGTAVTVPPNRRACATKWTDIVASVLFLHRVTMHLQRLEGRQGEFIGATNFVVSFHFPLAFCIVTCEKKSQILQTRKRDLNRSKPHVILRPIAKTTSRSNTKPMLPTTSQAFLAFVQAKDRTPSGPFYSHTKTPDTTITNKRHKKSSKKK